jgi:hypothetical protein
LQIIRQQIWASRGDTFNQEDYIYRILEYMTQYVRINISLAGRVPSQFIFSMALVTLLEMKLRLIESLVPYLLVYHHIDTIMSLRF